MSLQQKYMYYKCPRIVLPNDFTSWRFSYNVRTATFTQIVFVVFVFILCLLCFMFPLPPFSEDLGSRLGYRYKMWRKTQKHKNTFFKKKHRAKHCTHGGSGVVFSVFFTFWDALLPRQNGLSRKLSPWVQRVYDMFVFRFLDIVQKRERVVTKWRSRVTLPPWVQFSLDVFFWKNMFFCFCFFF